MSTRTRGPSLGNVTVGAWTRPCALVSRSSMATRRASSTLPPWAVAVHAASCAAAVATWWAWYTRANCTARNTHSITVGMTSTVAVVALPRSLVNVGSLTGAGVDVVGLGGDLGDDDGGGGQCEGCEYGGDDHRLGGHPALATPVDGLGAEGPPPHL